MRIIFCIALITWSYITSANPLTKERWIAEPFANALGGGPSTGPIEQSGADTNSICQNKQGNIFIIDGQIIDIVTPDGIRRHLAGIGELGFQDGAARFARFKLGVRAFYGARSLACGLHNDVFIADSGNQRIRRLFKNGSTWTVSTWAGGGKQRLETNQTTKPDAIKLGGTLAVAVRTNGELVIGGPHGYYIVDAEGKHITLAGKWPLSTSNKADQPAQLNIMRGDNDDLGNTYFVANTPNVVIQITPDNKAIHLAGLVNPGNNKRKIGDGMPRKVWFGASSSIAANPDGSALYLTGGDEYDIRLIPTNMNSSTHTLMQNGQWYKASVHPNASRGPAVIKPAANGKLKPDGELTNLMVSYLYGRDYQGNLFCGLNQWSGMSQLIEGEGLLGTRVFRLRRTQSD
ncbi:MAG: hypothetical protein OEX83_07765 [Gammaproteobacteria bacterium]|nr:hypothetical protein [Gammaproteobacteria bacterium]